MELSMTGQNRVRGMIAIRDSVRKLLMYQTEDYPDSDIKKEQENLNGMYDAFQKKYGLLNSRGNSMVFSEDNSYPLLCSLEVLSEDGTLERKADMFYKRTVNPNVPLNRVDTPEEALAVTLAERAEVDLGRMEELCGKSRAEIEKELGGVIFRLPDAGEPCFCYGGRIPFRQRAGKIKGGSGGLQEFRSLPQERGSIGKGAAGGFVCRRNQSPPGNHLDSR